MCWISKVYVFCNMILPYFHKFEEVQCLFVHVATCTLRVLCARDTYLPYLFHIKCRWLNYTIHKSLYVNVKIFIF